jgi:hypothetical protein
MRRRRQRHGVLCAIRSLRQLAAVGAYVGSRRMRTAFRLPAALGLGMVAPAAFFVVSFVASAEHCTN